MSRGLRAVVISVLLCLLLLSTLVGGSLVSFALSLITWLEQPLDARTVARNGPLFVPPGIAYNPRGFLQGPSVSMPSREQILADLRLLRTSGFRSVVTYGASGTLGTIPELARQEGFDGMVILGIWDPFSQAEWDNAVVQAPFVDGYCLGNEGLGRRYSPDALASKMLALRRVTGRPVTTTEPIDSYLTGPHREWLLAHSDWLFPLAQPFFATQLAPEHAVHWILARYDYLVAMTGSSVILKEAGFPSAGVSGGSPESQRAFFEVLDATGLPFFYFEAFDQPWKSEVFGQPQVEAHWGLYHRDGTPKKVIPWVTNRWSE